MPDNSARLPAEHRAGDTLSQTVSLPDYPASDGWALSYTLVGPSAVYTLSTAAAGDDFTVAVLAATTAAWAAGTYTVHAVVTKAAERYTVDTAQLRILADLSAIVAGTDLRTHARKVLDAIEAWLESKAPVAASLQVAGRRLDNYPITELLALRDRYRAEVFREERTAAGKGATRILMRL
jgi:hypothetical protein